MSPRLPLVALLTIGLVACSSDSDVRVADTEETAPETTAPDESTPETTAPDDTTVDTTSPDDQTAGELAWGECDDELVDQEAGMECATFTVPLDYDAPDGDTIDLALIRVPASGDRQGAVLFNPGGPGASGFDPIAINGPVLSSELGIENFDLIGFDPRGVDRSGGIRCVTDEVFDKYLYVDSLPDTPEEETLLEESESVFVDGCLAEYGDALNHYSTANTARDMDAIRAALGDDQLSFLGISYGTYLGAVYASMFPDNVRAFVLDAAYEPNGDTIEQQYITQAVGFEGAFDNWAAWCQENTTCAFNAADVAARWDALRTQLDTTPVPADDGRLGSNAVMERATIAALYSDSQWPVLAKALADVEAGNPTGIFALADEYNGRSPDGTFSTLFQSYSVIECASDIDNDVPDDPAALVAAVQEAAPRFGADYRVEDFDADSDTCAKLTPEPELIELDYQGDGAVVVIGGTNDPATPFRWAEEMAAAMGPNAALVTYTGEGHGQLLSSTCVTAIEAAVLADAELPDDGTTCDPDPPVEQPSWWGDVPTPEGVSEPEELPAVLAALGAGPTQVFAEVRTTDLALDDADTAYADALESAGFTSLGENPIGIDGTSSTAYTIDGEILLVISLGPEAFDTEELGSVKASVPAGKTVVLLAYLPG
jgi:pimeloyl-ACP methyl ester carboxylesterase